MVNHLADRTHAPFRERLFRGLIIQPDGCVTWSGYKLKGYGRIRQTGKTVYTHRAMWEIFNGPVPAGMVLDHLCKNTACANLSHLQVVTPSVNCARTSWAEKETCPRGHPLDGVTVRRSGQREGRAERYCLTCNRDRARERS